MAHLGMPALFAALGMAVAAAGPAAAQTASRPAAAASPAPQDESEKAAFSALSEEDRKAAQDALIWMNLYNGVVDGQFAHRTRDAIRAYQGAQKVAVDGILTRDQLAALKAGADKARAAVGFRIVDEPTTGIRIGAPTRLLGKTRAEKGSFVWSDADGALRLELVAPSGPGADLDEIYDRLSASAPGRRVLYKTGKPGAFFVVSVEEGGRKIYARYARSAAGLVRGFSFAYPTARANELDRVAVAVANAFDPFPAPAPAPLAAVLPPPRPTDAPGASVAPDPRPVARPPAEPKLFATAIVPAAGIAVTAISPDECPQPRIGAAGVGFLSYDPASGLAVLHGDIPQPEGPLALGKDAPASAVVVSLAPGGEGKSPTLQVGEAAPLPREGGAPSYLVALGPAGRGAPVFDRRGALVALIAPSPVAGRVVSGVDVATPRRAITGPALAAALGAASAPTGDILGAGEIARQLRSRIVGVYCAP